MSNKLPYEAPKYPRVAFEDDARRKLSREDIAEIKSLYKKGWAFKSIGNYFGVSSRTAHYHADSEWASQQNKKRYQMLKKQLADDPELVKQRNYEFNQRFLERARNDPAVREFKVKHTYKWKKNKYHTDEEFKEVTQKQAREKYHRDMETQPEKLRERWRRKNQKKKLMLHKPKPATGREKEK